jgi:hypothetical protein
VNGPAVFQHFVSGDPATGGSETLANDPRSKLISPENHTQPRSHMVLPNEIILAFSANPLYPSYRENDPDHQQDFLA